MKASGTGRVLAVVLIGCLFGAYKHYVQMRALSLGRTGYLATQSQWFDKVSNYHSGVTMILAGIILAVLAFGVYEIVAAGFTRLIPPAEIDE